jgi:P-type Cu2+ transporter
MDHESHNMQGMKPQVPMHSMHTESLKDRFLVSIFFTIPVLFLSQAIQGWLHYNLTLPYQSYILLVLALIIYGYGGWPFLKGLIQELSEHRPGMMTLIGTAVSVAFFFSTATVFFPVGNDFFWELATLIDVMLLGHWLEARSVLGASRALEELVRVMPATAHMVEDGMIMDMPASELKIGDSVLIRPGEKAPSDGIVIEGESFVNEALLTGESKPVHKEPLDRVIGGAVNGDGALTLRIERIGEGTYLSQVVRLVKQAQESRSRTQDLANRAAALLFYVALAVGAVTFAVWASLGNVQFALTRTVTVLVIACPHALGLAIPLVVALSTTIAAKSGILIRDRSAFENAKDIDLVVFDKTGTLTMGQFGISNIISFVSEQELLTLTAAVEKNSEHTIAKAIVKYAEEKGVTVAKTQIFQAIPGKGAKATVNGSEVYVGSPSLLNELSSQPLDKRVLELQKTGKTIIVTTVAGQLVGIFALEDLVRKESGKTVEALKARGIRVYMLTGDSEEVARSVTEELAIDAYFAGVLPNKKAEKIKELKAQGFRVAMVGDGINDAPALVTANLGIAIGSGTDVAVESADVILVKNDPWDVITIIDFSKRTYSKMIQNLWWAAGYNIFAIPLAAGIFTGLGLVVDPSIGAILMSLSTVLVAINSQTLRRSKK